MKGAKVEVGLVLPTGAVPGAVPVGTGTVPLPKGAGALLLSGGGITPVGTGATGEAEEYGGGATGLAEETGTTGAGADVAGIGASVGTEVTGMTGAGLVVGTTGAGELAGLLRVSKGHQNCNRSEQTKWNSTQRGR